MNELLEKIKRGEVAQRVITYMGHRVIEHFQKNKDVPDTYDRYMMPLNRDKSQAIMHNYALSIDEIKKLLTV
jgi:hypothetical protein